MGKTAASTPAADAAVQGTNDASIVSKLSMEQAGYVVGARWLTPFVERPRRRAPLIHRGYHVRACAMDHVVDGFLQACSDAGHMWAQIVSLGCGFDPTFYRLASCNDRSVKLRYFDVDFAPVLERKRALMRTRAPELAELESGRDTYCALPCDLRDAEALGKALTTGGAQPDTPTLVVAECVFTYMPPAAGDAALRAVQRLFKHCIAAVYEQTRPYGQATAFAAAMEAHFERIDSPLQGLDAFPTLAAHAQRLRSCGFSDAAAMDLYWFWHHIVSPAERARVLKLEPFDEWDEWYQYCSHYMVAVGSQGECASFHVARHFDASRRRKLPHSRDGDLPLPCVERVVALPEIVRAGHVAFPHTGPQRGLVVFAGGFGLSGSGGSCAIFERLGGDCVLSVTSGAMMVERPDAGFPALQYASATQLECGTAVFGGRASPGRVSSDLWLWSNDSWRRVAVSSTSAPEARYRHAACLGFSNNELIVYGGRDSTGKTLNSMWIGSVASDGSTVAWEHARDPHNHLVSLHSCTLHHAKEDDFLTKLKSCSVENLLIMGGLGNDDTALFCDNAALGVMLLRGAEADEPIRVIPAGPVQFLHVDSMQFLAPRFGHSAVALNENVLLLIGGSGMWHGEGNLETPVVAVSLEDRSWVALDTPVLDTRLLIGAAAVLVESDGDSSPSVAVIGGGGTCFSMGSSWSRSAVLVSGLDVSALEKRLTRPGECYNGIVFEEEEADINWEQLLHQRKPTVVRELPLGPCMNLWTDPEWMSRAVGSDRRVAVHKSSVSALDFVQRNFEYATVPWEELVCQIQTPSSAAGGYCYLRALSDRPRKEASCFFRDYPSLAPTLTLPEPLAAALDLDQSTGRYFSSVLRASSLGVRLWTHYDVMDNVLINVTGRKRVYLWPPNFVEALEVVGSSSAITRLDLVGCGTPEARAYWQATPARREFVSKVWPARHNVELFPGDALVLPSCWFHHVTALGPGYAVNVFYRGISDPGSYGVLRRDLYGNLDLRGYEKALHQWSLLQPTLDAAGRDYLVKSLRLCAKVPYVPSRGDFSGIFRALDTLPESHREFYTLKLAGLVSTLQGDSASAIDAKRSG